MADFLATSRGWFQGFSDLKTQWYCSAEDGKLPLSTVPERNKGGLSYEMPWLGFRARQSRRKGDCGVLWLPAPSGEGNSFRKE